MRQDVSKTIQTFLVLDDHQTVLSGTVDALKHQYPQAEIHTVQTAQAADQWIQQGQPDLFVTDLSIPQDTGGVAQTDTGIELLKALMQRYPTLNIVVQSANVKSLVRLKLAISNHEGGFTIADKNLPLQEMLTRVDWALKGVAYTPKEMRTGLELKPEWLQVLQLADKGAQDKAIADRMMMTESNIRHYWRKIQDALEVYPQEGQNMRIITLQRARQEGLID